VALGGLGISPADITMLYAGIAEGGAARGLRYVEGAPDAPQHRLFGAWRRIISGTSRRRDAARRLGDGRRLAHARTSAFKTGSLTVSRCVGVGFSNDYTVGVWVRPRRRLRRAPAVSTRCAARSCSRCLASCRRTSGTRPATCRRPSWAEHGQLPPSLRVFSREAELSSRTDRGPPPSISFRQRHSGAAPSASAKDKTVMLKAVAGRRRSLGW